jgi:hypothetical protein
MGCYNMSNGWLVKQIQADRIKHPRGPESSSTILLECLILHAGNTFIHNVDTYSVITRKIPLYMTIGFALPDWYRVQSAWCVSNFRMLFYELLWVKYAINRCRVINHYTISTLTLWRLMATIVVVLHHLPPDTAF